MGNIRYNNETMKNDQTGQPEEKAVHYRIADSDWQWESEEEARRIEELFGEPDTGQSKASRRRVLPDLPQYPGRTAPGSSSGRKKKKHYFIRRSLVGLAALAAGTGMAFVVSSWIPEPETGRAMLSSKKIDEMVRERLMNQTSRNLERIPVFAHRGFDDDSLENSFAAFDTALLSGCPQVELDVRASSDGVLYVCHDETLSHVAGLDWKVSDHTSSELDQVIMKNGENLHRLSDVIGRYRDQLIYLIEFKEDTDNPTPFLDVVEQYPQYASTMQIQSFYPTILEAIHSKLPNMFVQLLINEYWEIFPALDYDWLDSLALDEKLITQDRVREIHDAGKEVWLWTVDDPNKIREFLSWGADGVITNMESAVTIYKEMSGQE